jgi:hypothetical protein
VRLAHTEPAVQVDPCAGRILLGEQFLEQSPSVTCPDAAGKSFKGPDGMRLAGLLGVRTVTRKGDLAETRRGKETLQELIHRY